MNDINPKIIFALKILNKTIGTIIEVGAYDGLNCIIFGHHFPEAVIHAIEPCPKNSARVTKLTKTYPNIVSHKLALSNGTGVQDFYTISDGSRYTSSKSNSLFEKSVMRKNSKGSKVVTVDVMTLKHFCLINSITEIDLLRLNCEGGEYLIFEDKNSLDVLDNINIIELSLHGKNKEFNSKKFDNKKIRINQILRGKGFRLVDGEEVQISTPDSKHQNQIWMK